VVCSAQIFAEFLKGAIFCFLPRSFSSCVSWAPDIFLLSSSFSIRCFLAQRVSRLFDFVSVSAVPAVRYPTADFHFGFLPACRPSTSANLFFPVKAVSFLPSPRQEHMQAAIFIFLHDSVFVVLRCCWPARFARNFTCILVCFHCDSSP
jgi:hypothetical protein